MTVNEYNDCVDEHADALYRFILKNIGEVEKARDIVQETYAKMWVKIDDVTSSKAKSYMFSTAYHTMIDQIRREKKQGNFDEVKSSSLAHNQQYSDLNEILHEALDKLPEEQKMLVLLRDYEGYSYKEIGEICKLSQSQVKVYIFRARVFLKAYLVSVETIV